MSGSHAGFILAAYGATALILAAMIGASLLDWRSARRRLAALEAGRGPAGPRAPDLRAP
ncbi:MAG: heme exporter protein CcmD [Rhabdaerophilum calidifontis]